jgi:hypothetical protein
MAALHSIAEEAVRLWHRGFVPIPLQNDFEAPAAQD